MSAPLSRGAISLLVTLFPASAWAAPPPPGGLFTSPTGQRLHLVPGAAFTLGCPTGGSCPAGASPPVAVTIRRDLLVMEREVNQGDFTALMKRNPSRFAACGLDCPVDSVTWTEAATYANRLSELEGLPPCYDIRRGDVAWESGPACIGYRLPTEAEWELAARGGAETAEARDLVTIQRGWFLENSGEQTQAVAGKAPNAYGLRDMAGNVWEWVWDGYAAYPSIPMADPVGKGVGGFRVTRGGSWSRSVAKVHLQERVGADIGTRNYDLGFRLVRTWSEPGAELLP